MQTKHLRKTPTRGPRKLQLIFLQATQNSPVYVYTAVTTFSIPTRYKPRLLIKFSLRRSSTFLSVLAEPVSVRLILRFVSQMGPIVLTQVATGLSVLAGAALVKSVMDQKPMAGPFDRCPSCNGTGRVTCMCTRWSDGDVGCRTCAGSGRMACRSCGGTGTGRPLPVQVSVRRPNRPS